MFKICQTCVEACTFSLLDDFFSIFSILIATVAAATKESRAWDYAIIQAVQIQACVGFVYNDLICGLAANVNENVLRFEI